MQQALAQSPLRASPDPLTVRVSTSSCDDDWDRFVAGSPHGFHEQTNLWSQVKAVYGWEPLRLILSDAQGIVAGVQILVRAVRGGYRVGYASRGPVVALGDPQRLSFVLDEMVRAARTHKVSYLAIAPPYDGNALEAPLRLRGFRRKPDPLPPARVMEATLLIDLSPDLASIQARMRMQVRQHIRLAQRTGVVVREGGKEDVETFRALMCALCRRRGIAPTPPETDFFQNLWAIFAPRGWVRIFLAEVEGQPVSALLVFTFGDTARVWKAGWSGEFADRRPNNLLYWEAVRWARQNGFRCFDLVGIERELAEQLLHDEKIDWTKVTGPCNFKVGFGGSPVVLPETCYRILDPWASWLLRVGGRRLIESPRLAHLFEQLSA